MLRRLICWCVGHALPEGVKREWSIRFECVRCKAMVNGKLGGRP